MRSSRGAVRRAATTGARKATTSARAPGRPGRRRRLRPRGRGRRRRRSSTGAGRAPPRAAGRAAWPGCPSGPAATRAARGRLARRRAPARRPGRRAAGRRGPRPRAAGASTGCDREPVGHRPPPPGVHRRVRRQDQVPPVLGEGGRRPAGVATDLGRADGPTAQEAGDVGVAGDDPCAVGQLGAPAPGPAGTGRAAPGRGAASGRSGRRGERRPRRRGSAWSHPQGAAHVVSAM